MRPPTRGVAGGTLAGLLALSFHASAALVTYQNQAAWQAAVAGADVGTLADVGLDASDWTVKNTPCPNQCPEIQIAATSVLGDGLTMTIATANVEERGGFLNFSNGTLYSTLNFSNDVALAVSQPIYAFGADFTFTTGEDLSIAGPFLMTASGFYGYISSTPTTVSGFFLGLCSDPSMGPDGKCTNTAFDMSNLQIVVATPEPAGFWLVGVGLLGAFMRRDAIRNTPATEF